MSAKILVVDDSLTIQKVINITLANSGYSLTECHNEKDLLDKIKNSEYDLILLDFNLSDSKTGYELASEIKHSQPNSSLVIMLGTFDTVDENLFLNNGISDKIVKPFESAKFIKKCQDLIENRRPIQSVEKGLEIKSKVVEKEIQETNNSDDQWTVASPGANHLSEIDNKAATQLEEININVDPLKSEIAGWGFESNSKPLEFDENDLEIKFQKKFPPQINANPTKNLQFNSVAELVNFEEESIDFQVSEKVEEKKLAFDLEESIEKDFWAVDEIISNENEEKILTSKSTREETEDLTELVHDFANANYEELDFKTEPNVDTKDNIQNAAANASSLLLNQDEFIEKLKSSLRPLIAELVKEQCSQIAEKVAWDIIPDLAENLIRKEIKDISESVKLEH